jgi:hypothetical protein
MKAAGRAATPLSAHEASIDEITDRAATEPTVTFLRQMVGALLALVVVK